MNASTSLPRLGSGPPASLSPRSRPSSSASSHGSSSDFATMAVATARLSISNAALSNVESAVTTQPKQQSALLRPLGSSVSLQELEMRQAKKASSPWVTKYQEQAKSDLVKVDIMPLMDRFENTALYQKPHRKPLQLALQEMATPTTPLIASDAFADASEPEPLSDRQQLPQKSSELHSKGLKRQTTKDRVKRRTDPKSQRPTSSWGGRSTGSEADDRTAPTARARIVPSRFLYDTSRWKQSARCDYCNFAGGDLECATCDVIAHARCYLAAYESIPKKTKTAFVVPTRFSWLCLHCQQSLQDEYDERSKNARMQHIAMQRTIFGKVVTAYVRMTKDAVVFQAKKKAIIKIQAVIRGKLARWRFDRLQRMCLKPYAIDAIKVRGFNGDGVEVTAATEDLRLSNGFTCNPYVYVSIVDGKDDENQLFCFETTLRKGVSILDTEIAWNDKLFVPGVDGNITLCFTLLSKNGPNNFFLGQALLRLRDSDVIWRSGITTELNLTDEVEIFPKNTQRQLLRLVEIGGAQVRNGRNISRQQQRSGDEASGMFANSSSFALTLCVHIKPFSEVHSYCGYMGMKNTLDSFQISSRWCVLADGVLRIYRHFGVILASDVVDMARTIDIKLVETNKVANNGVLHREQNCIAIHHMNRLYLLQCNQRGANRVWLKKLLAATKFGATGVSGPSSQQTQTIASTSNSRSELHGTRPLSTV